MTKSSVTRMIAVLLATVLTFVGGIPGAAAGIKAEAAGNSIIKWDSALSKAIRSKEALCRFFALDDLTDEEFDLIGSGYDLYDSVVKGKSQYTINHRGYVNLTCFKEGYAIYVNGKKITDHPVGEKYGEEIDYEFSGTVTLTYKKIDGSGAAEMSEPGPENTDETIWVNGKDTKENKKTGTPASLYKSEGFEWAMSYSGGKMQVAVTDGNVGEEQFMAMFDEKGKLEKNAAATAKQYATAKLSTKDGSVTVTAGKTVPPSGFVRVWVYELKNNTVVNTTQKGNPYYGKYDTDIYPHSYDFDVLAAPDMTFTAKKLELTKNGGIPPVGTSEKLAKGYDAGKTVDVYFGDKKNEIDPEATEYVIWDKKNKTALAKAGETYTGDGFTAKIVTDDGAPYVRIAIGASATEKTKIEVNVLNLQSQKIASIKPKVNKKK